MTFPTIEFQTPWALALLILLPIWWLWRRKRSEDAIVFSRTAVLGRGPRAGQGIARAIFFLRNLVIVGLAQANVIDIARMPSPDRRKCSL